MASRLTEISLDCHDPDLLADFWTAALDWQVLDRDEDFSHGGFSLKKTGMSRSG